MISIARKNLSSLFSNPNHILRNSIAHSFLSIHLFSTSCSRVRRRPTPCPEIFNALFHKHQFSPEFATSIASMHLPSFEDPKRIDSVLSFLKENCFTTSQLERIVIYNPRILGFTIEGLESRFSIFRDLGLSSEEIAKMMSSNQSILHSNMKNSIIPKLSMLKGLLGSDDNVARLLRKSPWFVTSDLDKILIPNVETLKRCGIPMERILRFLYTRPRVLLVKPDIMRKSVDKAIEFGLPRTLVVFIQAVGVFSFTSQEMWEVKLQTLRDLGFSDDEIFSIFRKQPLVVTSSEKQLKSAMELLLGTGKYTMSNIVTCPSALKLSIEKRIKPRLRILKLLESRNLIKKWPCLSRLALATDAKFLDRFVSPYREEVGEAFTRMSYLGGKINETWNTCARTGFD